ncbi:PREDICTED: uncharacterized protein LOC108973029 isoform X1 [Bactrocera latifrons]|uniref:MARVEL domain-containing protein n=1 Tax=Bactrocera latifrons TaxID=174628 RepID=A0A0K8UM99_BACLA|nr:PREDICTED: uncharacterized protein LOC108973029 isoform X1 [Bactrocera latifrons]
MPQSYTENVLYIRLRSTLCPQLFRFSQIALYGKRAQRRYDSLCAVAGITCIAVSLAPVTNLRGLVYMCVMACACLGSALVFLNNFCEMRFCRRHFCNATRFELYIHATLAVLCFLASSAALTLALVTYSIAAFFGYVAFCLYALEAWFNYKRYRQRDMSTQT